MMKWIVTAFLALLGLVAGAAISYFIFAPVYLAYASYHPLDPSAECARGGALAYLSMLLGGLAGCILTAFSTWRSFEKHTSA